MFFELHNEKRIGYKEMTDADLGRKLTSHQTHIGLFDDVLTFLPNNIEINDCMMIYNKSVEFLSLNFDRIENPDGSFRSPKIRAGGRDVVSIVTFIRDKAKDFPNDTKWYLFWFGLKSEQPVFFLFNNLSDTYKEILALGVKLPHRIKGRITPMDSPYSALLKYLESVVNSTGDELVQELEVVAQTNEPTITKKYREYDIKRAQELFTKIGKEGEFLVDRYFEEQKRKGLIANYKWFNEEKEGGRPYDFYFETLDGEIVYLDVKTTNYQFAQKMVFSSQEIGFATSSANKYCIYRVFTNEKGEHCLKICANTKDLFVLIQEKTANYQDGLIELATIETIKMAILPIHKLLTFGQSIVLSV